MTHHQIMMVEKMMENWKSILRMSIDADSVINTWMQRHVIDAQIRADEGWFKSEIHQAAYGCYHFNSIAWPAHKVQRMLEI